MSTAEFQKFTATLLMMMGLASSPAVAENMNFRLSGNGGNCPRCGWIAAEGDIQRDSAERFLKFMIENGLEPPRGVALHSEGGSLVGGIKLGRVFRELGITTLVARTVANDGGWDEQLPGACSSACAFAFIGGRTRLAQEGELGVHQFYSEMAIEAPDEKQFSGLDLSENQIIAGILIEYTHSMGVDPRFISIAAATPPQDMHFFSSTELTDLRIDWDPWEFEAWQIEPYGNGVVAYSKTRNKERTATVYCSDTSPTPHFLMAWENPETAAFLRENFDVISGLEALGAHAGKSSLRLVSHDGVARVLAMLPDLDPDFLRVAPEKTLPIEVDAPRFATHSFDWELPLVGSADAIRVALKNCL